MLQRNVPSGSALEITMSRIKSTLKSLGVKRGDLLMAAALLAVAAVMGVIIFAHSGESAYAVVTVDGKEMCRLPLDEDCLYPIGDTNTIEISDGTVRMIEADCPDKVCINTGRISKSGQTIVCLPNKVVITITGTDSSTDAYTN